jgi:cytidylate kinase
MDYLDTGAFYRAATLAVLEAGADPDNEEEVEAVVARVVIDQEVGETRLNGRDVTDAIRSEEVTASVSAVSSHRGVRARMVEAQRAWVAAHGGKAVVEGRDIGTIVFPDAPLKVFLDAHPRVRAERRSAETGSPAETVAEALRRRDHLDSSREASPLRPAADAVVIDTSDKGIEEVVGAVLELWGRRLRPA